jgi:hypothetical protein
MIAMMTCPRPTDADYVIQTTEALMREGAKLCHERIAIVDGQDAPFLPGWQMSFSASAEKLGVRRTMWRAFEAAIESHADKLLLVEDDIRPCRNAVKKILSMDVPADAAFIDFHDMKELREENRPGLYPIAFANIAYWGNQCMLFPRRTIEWLVEHDPTSIETSSMPNGADRVLGLLLERSPWPSDLIHLPRLVNHVGAISIAHEGMNLDGRRATANYPGDEFDAMTL